MLFNSFAFLFFFLPFVLLAWWKLRNSFVRLLFLIFASYCFYAWWDWRFLPLILATTTVDYVAAKWILVEQQAIRKKLWLVAAITCNLALLAVFKYSGLISFSLNQVSRLAGFGDILPITPLVFPLGISFYTLNSMSYTIDVYRGVERPAKGLMKYSAFVAMFPHLIAGPLLRYHDIEKQFDNLKARISSAEALRGIHFFAIGMFEKVILADRLAHPVNAFFSHASKWSFTTGWTAVIAFSLQLYFDFAGYSDMAIGLAQLLGIQFPQNFRSPYRAINIADFVRRWHITLGLWMRDYVFVPLGGFSRSNKLRSLRNVLVTLTIVGLWHGPRWTYVLCGLYIGVLLAIYFSVWRTRLAPRSTVAARVITFFSVTIGFVLFRSDTLSQAGQVFWALFGGNGFSFGALTWHAFIPLAILLTAATIASWMPNAWELTPQPTPRYAIVMASGLSLSMLFINASQPFLYFQF